MIPLYTRTAKVIDNVDPNKKGAIKIRVLPELKDVLDVDLLPWATPYCVGEGSQIDVGENRVPEIDSIIQVIVEDEKWTEFYYLDGDYVSGLYPYAKWENIKGNMSEIESTEYPQPHFTAYKDGTVIFNNTENGETGIYHSSGKYVLIDKDGKVFINGEMKISEDLEIEGDTKAGGTKTLVTYSALNTALSTFKSAIQVALNAHKHIDPLSGVTGIPAPPNVVPDFGISGSETTKITSA